MATGGAEYVIGAATDVDATIGAAMEVDAPIVGSPITGAGVGLEAYTGGAVV